MSWIVSRIFCFTRMLGKLWLKAAMDRFHKGQVLFVFHRELAAPAADIHESKL